jgi:hypothetical protein
MEHAVFGHLHLFPRVADNFRPATFPKQLNPSANNVWLALKPWPNSSQPYSADQRRQARGQTDLTEPLRSSGSF